MDWRAMFKNPAYWLLAFIPITVVLEHAVHPSPVVLFICSGLGIVPLTMVLSKATESLADRLGEGLGGFLNATFANMPELIIGAMGLRAGLHDVVKASITGCILNDVIMIVGLGALLAGRKVKALTFNRTTSGVGSTMLFLSAVGLLLPAVHHALFAKTARPGAEQDLSLEIAIVLFATYLLNLLFMLKTHRHLYSGTGHGSHGEGGHAEKHSVLPGILTMAVAAVLLALMSEMLVGSVEGTGKQLGFNPIFMGVIFLSCVGNVAELVSGVNMAMKGKMDACMAIAIGAANQVALFLAPMLVFLSYFLGPGPMGLLFSPLEVLALLVAVCGVTLTSHDGDINWLEGVQLIAVYLMLAVAFFNIG